MNQIFSPNIILIGIILYVSYFIIQQLKKSHQVKLNKLDYTTRSRTESIQEPEIIKQYITNNSSNSKNLDNIIRNNNKNIFN
jgi:hypothetical protein